MTEMNPYALVFSIIITNVILWVLFVAPLIYVASQLLRRNGDQLKYLCTLVRDFATFAASTREDYPSARFMAAASHLDEVEKIQSAGAKENEVEEDDKQVDITLTQRG